MTPNEILIGIALTVVLAVGSQILSDRLRIPAIVVLLPVGFIAGAATDVIVPTNIVGDAFEPLVSLAVALILFASGMELDLRRLAGSTRRVVTRLILLGIVITWVLVTFFASLLLDMPAEAAAMIGVILVVSGPTVVGPLLSYVRPGRHLQPILAWEGSVIDPIGAILGALTFHAIVGRDYQSGLTLKDVTATGYEIGQFALSVAVGMAGALIGTAVLWLLLRHFSLSEVLGTSGALATVVAVSTVCDIARDDTGLIPAILMGIALANLPGFDIPARRPFFETVVQLVIGILFISISATVTPESVLGVLWPTLTLVAVLVLVARPLVAHVATRGTELSMGERSFVGWMAPRGIVAAATASAFSADLVDEGIDAASDILPATFLVIVGTVTLYGLTAVPVARWFGVTRPAASLPLIVGGEEWAVALARELRAQGLDVVMWAGAPRERRRIQEAGLTLAPGELVANAAGGGAELEGITMVLLLTNQDDFNALAAVALQGTLKDGVYRVAEPSKDVGVVAPFTPGELLFGPPLTGVEIVRRHRAGAEIMSRRADEPRPDGATTLFVLRANRRLEPVTASATPRPAQGDTHVLLGPVPSRKPTVRPADDAAKARRANAAAGPHKLTSSPPAAPKELLALPPR